MTEEHQHTIFRATYCVVDCQHVAEHEDRVWVQVTLEPGHWGWTGGTITFLVPANQDNDGLIRQAASDKIERETKLRIPPEQLEAPFDDNQHPDPAATGPAPRFTPAHDAPVRPNGEIGRVHGFTEMRHDPPASGVMTSAKTKPGKKGKR